MGQISIKLPDEDIEFLEWYQKKHATAKATLYRDITLETFRNRKKEILLNSYLKGDVTFKEFCLIGGLTFLEAMILIEQSEVEPNIPEIIDQYTNQLTDLNIKNKDYAIFKSKKPTKRKTPPVEFLD